MARSKENKENKEVCLMMESCWRWWRRRSPGSSAMLTAEVVAGVGCGGCGR